MGVDELSVKLAEENYRLKETLRIIKEKLSSIDILVATWDYGSSPEDKVKIYDMSGNSIGKVNKMMKEVEVMGGKEMVASINLNIKKLLGV